MRYSRATGALVGLSIAAAGIPGWAASPRSSAKSPPARVSKPARPVAPTLSRDPYLGAIAIDATTGAVLFEDRADEKGHPASMLKLMTLMVVLDKISAGELRLADPVKISAEASRIGGSQVFLAENETFTVDELLYALMVQSANDAALALAEHVAGSREAFVALMNRKARDLRLDHTAFQSVHGLPPGRDQAPDWTTARDFAALCRELLARHPETLAYTSTRTRAFRPQKPFMMQTHNHLLGVVEGCDGLKTGYYREAGYSIAATAGRNGARVIVVVLGSVDRKTRDAKTRELLVQALGKARTSTSVSTPVALPPTTLPPPTPAAP